MKKTTILVKLAINYLWPRTLAIHTDLKMQK